MLIEFDEEFRNKIPIEDQNKIKNQDKFHHSKNI